MNNVQIACSALKYATIYSLAHDASEQQTFATSILQRNVMFDFIFKAINRVTVLRVQS